MSQDGDAADGLHPEVEDTADAIARMDVRGAATIGKAAASALAVQAGAIDSDDPDVVRRRLREAAQRLYDTRPTAVSLPNALRHVLGDLDGDTADAVRRGVRERAERFREDLDRAQSRLGRVGANRLQDGDVVMFHCHSTDALACIEAAVDRGKRVEAIVKETRPRQQGHITARRLRELDVPVTLIVDNAARRYLTDADHVLVGADSIAADGSVINKIGTSGLAVNARDRGVPITVAAQTIKLHPGTLTGHTVEIEHREEQEVLSAEGRREITGGNPDEGLTVHNPAFDVTPPRYVDAIVTERGQFPPESIVTLMRELFGDSVGDPWRPTAEGGTDAAD